MRSPHFAGRVTQKAPVNPFSGAFCYPAWRHDKRPCVHTQHLRVNHYLVAKLFLRFAFPVTKARELGWIASKPRVRGDPGDSVT